MKFLLLLPILLVSFVPNQEPTVDDNAPVAVVSFRWFKDRRSSDMADVSATGQPAPAMIPANKNFERQRRMNDPTGVRDPNADTIDGRSAELDRIVQESRESRPPVDGYTYQARIQNKSGKAVKTVFWEYQFKEKVSPANLSRRQFVCLAKMKPDKTKDLDIFTMTAPSGVVSVGALARKSSVLFEESVLINRVEYEDGSVWQRRGWNYDEVRLTVKPAAESKKLQACRGL